MIQKTDGKDPFSITAHQGLEEMFAWESGKVLIQTNTGNTGIIDNTNTGETSSTVLLAMIVILNVLESYMGELMQVVKKLPPLAFIN